MDIVVLLRKELLSAENILNTEYSFDLAEPNYRRCLELINGSQVNRTEVLNLMTSMFENREVSEEPIAYLMHILRWHEVREWAEKLLACMDNPMLYGRPLEKILEAYSDSWENRDFYTFSDK
jgi:uncharacterized protein (DUF1778 family)